MGSPLRPPTSPPPLSPFVHFTPKTGRFGATQNSPFSMSWATSPPPLCSFPGVVFFFFCYLAVSVARLYPPFLINEERCYSFQHCSDSTTPTRLGLPPPANLPPLPEGVLVDVPPPFRPPPDSPVAPHMSANGQLVVFFLLKLLFLVLRFRRSHASPYRLCSPSNLLQTTRGIWGFNFSWFWRSRVSLIFFFCLVLFFGVSSFSRLSLGHTQGDKLGLRFQPPPSQEKRILAPQHFCRPHQTRTQIF